MLSAIAFLIIWITMMVILAQTRKKQLWRGFCYGTVVGVLLWTGILVVVGAYAL